MIIAPPNGSGTKMQTEKMRTVSDTARIYCSLVCIQKGLVLVIHCQLMASAFNLFIKNSLDSGFILSTPLKDFIHFLMGAKGNITFIFWIISVLLDQKKEKKGMRDIL